VKKGATETGAAGLKNTDGLFSRTPDVQKKKKTEGVSTQHEGLEPGWLRL